MATLEERATEARVEHQRITARLGSKWDGAGEEDWAPLMHEMHVIGEALLKEWYESLPGEQSACVEVYLYLLDG